MAVGVCKTHRQIAYSPPNGSLHGVVDGVCLVLQTSDVPEPNQRTVGVGIVAAGNAEINQRSSRDRHAAWGSAGPAIVVATRANRLTGLVRIRRRKYGEKLV